MSNENTTGAAVEVATSSPISGSVAQRLLMHNFNVSALRTFDTLRKDEWIHYDQAVTRVAQQRLIGVQDLFSRGLVYNLPNALGKTVLEWEKVSDMNPAQVSMDGVTNGQNDRVQFGLDSMPIPIVHKDFRLNIRALSASRTTGEPLDTTQVSLATRKVVEEIERHLYLGTTILGSNRPIYGYTTAPNRITGSVTANWASATGVQIVADVIAMINAANAQHMYGPFQIYVPLAAHVNMSNDYKAESDKTIMSRVMEIPNVAGVTASETLSGTNVVMVQMTSDVVDIVNGIQPTLIQWSSGDGMTEFFKVLAIMPPRVKSDYADQSGIIHYA